MQLAPFQKDVKVLSAPVALLLLVDDLTSVVKIIFYFLTGLFGGLHSCSLKTNLADPFSRLSCHFTALC
jgi:hypothetical protein